MAPPMVLAKSAAPVAAIAGLRAGREEGARKGAQVQYADLSELSIEIGEPVLRPARQDG